LQKKYYTTFDQKFNKKNAKPTGDEKGFRKIGKADQMDLGSDDGLLEITDINIKRAR
jgi:hypothetical protein